MSTLRPMPRFQFVLILASFTASAVGQSRVFMDAAGNDGAGQPAVGNTVITMDAGTTQDIEVWIVDDSPLGPVLSAYQKIVQCVSQTQPGAAGTIDYVDNNPGMRGGDSIFIDTTRPDWVFAGSVAVSNRAFRETCSEDNLFGIIYFTAVPIDNIDVNAAFGSAPAYLTTFTLQASPDACGDHLISFNRADAGGSSPFASLFGPSGSQWLGDDSTPAAFQNLLVTIGPTNNSCDTAIVLTGGSGSEIFNTECATVDGPQDCASGADLWYEYTPDTTPLGGFVATVTNGDVAVYINDTCPPANPGACNSGPLPVQAGDTVLIQVIGDDISGTLDYACSGGCLSDSDCDDGNPCTDNQCNPDQLNCGGCVTVPNTDPCDDGDPCTMNDTCGGGTCQPGTPVDCDDFDACTNDTCLTGVGCMNDDINGTACTIDDDCNIGTVTGSICFESACFCGCDDNCCDADEDGIRDDGCVWCECNSPCGGTSLEIDIVFADMGGTFGDCFPDGVADNNDRFHALNCFANVDTNGNPGAYPCETSPPVALNVDAGGEFSSCDPDGVCDGNDAFAALNAFAGSSTCSCPLDGGAAPNLMSKPHVVDRTTLRLETATSHVRQGEEFEVHVYLDSPVRDLRGYQLHVGISGGQRGTLEIVDLSIGEAAVFDGLGAWSAFNTMTAQLVAGLSADGIGAPRDAYLATITLRADKHARGSFAIDLLHDATDRTERTYLFPTPAAGRIEVTAVTAAVVTVVDRRERTR